MCRRCMENETQREEMKNEYLDIVKDKDLTFAAVEVAKASRMNAAKELGVLMEFVINGKEAQRRVHDWMNGFLASMCTDDFDKAWESIRELIPGTPEHAGKEGASKKAHALLGIYQSFRTLYLPHADSMEILVHLNQLPEGDLRCVNDVESMKREAKQHKGNDPKFDSLDDIMKGLKKKITEGTTGKDIVEELAKALGHSGKDNISNLIAAALGKKFAGTQPPSCDKTSGTAMPFDRRTPPPSVN